MNFQPHIVLKISLVSLLVLAGCGQRGPLYHPEKPAALPKPAQLHNTNTNTEADATQEGKAPPADPSSSPATRAQ